MPETETLPEPAQEFVLLTHPDSDGTWKCPIGYVERAKSNGWKEATKSDKSKPKASA